MPCNVCPDDLPNPDLQVSTSEPYATRAGKSTFIAGRGHDACTAECRCNVVTDTDASLSISRRVGLFLSMCVESGGQVRSRIGIIVTL